MKYQIQSLPNSMLDTAVYFLLLIAIFLLTGCAKDPAKQCLDSFRDKLVSPRSAEAINLVDGNLAYLAKNRSGTEIQGKAICVQVGENWVRDSSAEYLKILQFSIDSFDSNKNCVDEKNPRSYCDMMHPIITPEIARIKLGYN